jgi:hypothetical protein
MTSSKGQRLLINSGLKYGINKRYDFKWLNQEVGSFDSKSTRKSMPPKIGTEKNNFISVERA